MTKCEQIIVNNAIVSGRIRQGCGRTIAGRTAAYLREMRHRNCITEKRYAVKNINGTYYTNSLPDAKRHALANRAHVYSDMMGWWSEECLCVKDVITGIVLYEAK